MSVNQGRYDICIIGAGMVGSAAAKYCALLQKMPNLILIGPDEPKAEDYCNREIFGAHYDEGRITRNLCSDPLWSHLASESIKRYRKIESETHTKFFTENGYLTLFRPGDQSLKNYQDTVKLCNIQAQYFPESKGLSLLFPYFNFPRDTSGLYEKYNSGFINPRVLTSAQQRLAIRHGCQLLRDIVTRIERLQTDGCYKIHTKSNGFLLADKVILCVGAFLMHNHLFPVAVNLNVKPKLIATARIPVQENQLTTFNGMPSTVMMTKTNDPSDILGEAFYVMAPVKYPDGKYYVKVGFHSDSRKGGFGNADDVTRWYRNGSAMAERSGLKLRTQIIAKAFMPELNVEIDEMVLDTCCLTETLDHRPIIDEIRENFYLFTGCNGVAAKSSDEIGRLLANMAVMEKWDCPFSRDSVRNMPCSKL